MDSSSATLLSDPLFDVADIPGCDASAAFVTNPVVFREQDEIYPVPVGDSDISYIPWGSDNQLPYRLIDRFEEDETLGACRDFLSEVTYAGGLRYVPSSPESMPHQISVQIEDFFIDNDIDNAFLASCADLKMFHFSVSVLIVSEDASSILSIYRKEACYCRFPPALPDGAIPYVIYANWRRPVTSVDNIEVIPLLDPRFPRADLRNKVSMGLRKIAVLTKIPGADSLYYPIPSYASLFRGHWYRIKRFIGIAKEAKLKNSAPIKYLIEISQRYWDELFRSEHITDNAKKFERIIQVKQEMISFLTGAANSGKALFSNFYISPDGREVHDVRITKIETDKEGGDWASDHAEAINMLCFAMRVHSNLVGSVPGKAQSNNSGSDKRELYTIAQTMQKPYRDIALRIHKLIIDFNKWPVYPSVPIIQLTTLDAHKDVQKSDTP